HVSDSRTTSSLILHAPRSPRATLLPYTTLFRSAGKITRKADEDNGQSSCITHCKRYNHTLCYDNDTRTVFHIYDVSLVYTSYDYWCRRICVLHYSGINR